MLKIERVCRVRTRNKKDDNCHRLFSFNLKVTNKSLFEHWFYGGIKLNLFVFYLLYEWFLFVTQALLL